MCTKCNEKNSNFSGCEECNPNPCNPCDKGCGCDFTVDDACVISTNQELPNIGSVAGDSLDSIHIKIDRLFSEINDKVVLGFLGRSVGTGEDVFIGKDEDGYENFRTLLGLNGVNVVSTEEEIEISIDETWLTTFINQSGSLPNATETTRGIIEIATQAEVDAGTDNERAVTPATLKDGVVSILEDNTTNITISPDNLPSATEIQKGIAEIANQAEVDAGIDDERYVTPAKMKQGIVNIFEDTNNNINIDPSQLPQATETQRGIIEVATQAEVNAGTDAERAVTPATLEQGVITIVQNNNSSGGALSFLPKYSIIEWGGNIATLPPDWYLCNGQTVNGFVTPDRRNKFTVEYDPSNPDYNTIGNTGGIDSNTLTELNLPEHAHDMDFEYSGAEQDNQIAFLRPVAFSDSNPQGESGGDGTGGANGDITLQTKVAGSSTPLPLDNRPSYIVTAHIIYLPQ